MALIDKLGAILQKALFSTSFTDIIEAIDGLKTRIEELDSKVNREVDTLRQELAEAEERLKAAESKGKGKGKKKAS